jgi:hypothetical protein
MRLLQWIFAVIVISLMIISLLRYYPDTASAKRHQREKAHVLPESITYVGPDRRPVIQIPLDRRGQ